MTDRPTGQPAILVLAAGLGKRMKSSDPKVLVDLEGEPLIHYLLFSIHQAFGAIDVGMVVSHQKERVREVVEKLVETRYSGLRVQYIDQGKPQGTGHAVQVALSHAWGKERIQRKDRILVIPGDVPLVRSTFLKQVAQPLKKKSPVRLVSFELENPYGYGRVIRKGSLASKIVEEVDANDRQKKIKEVSSSIYYFDSQFLSRSVQKLNNRNAQREFYLTDVVSFAHREKKKVEVLRWPDSNELLGVNSSWDWSVASQLMNERNLKYWSEQGVRFSDPRSVRVSAQSMLSEDVVVGPGVQIEGKTFIGKGTHIEANVSLKNVQVGSGVHIRRGTVAEDAVIDQNAKVGPYAHLRPGAVIGRNAKIGNFVEIKKSLIGEKTSVAHLSYVGDAEVGSRVNIGCGFVTCNFDGRTVDGQRKHRTIIEDDVFMGSDCQTIAPVRIEKGAYVASGSTITDNVEPGALAIARSRQVVKKGLADRLLRRHRGNREDRENRTDREGREVERPVDSGIRPGVDQEK